MGDAAALAAGPAPEIVGRDAERARIDAFVAALPLGARALVIRGDPGIGKTALWRYALEQSRRMDVPVLVTRPAEEEMPLALVGLLDLFEHVELDPAALDAGSDPAVRGRAVLEALRRLAAMRPAVVAVDDAQWLDSVSARALRYALRRLDTEPVGVLTTMRRDSDPADPLAAASALPPGRCETLDLGPLSMGALRRVLGRVVTAISRPALRRIHEVSGGNPLYAIELARGLARASAGDRAPAALRLPESLRAAIAERIRTVPADLTPLLETASALGRTSVRELREALPGHDVDRLLAVAGEHELLVLEDDLGVQFSHPIVASVVYWQMSPLARRSVHARLARGTVDPDLRARHLALSTDEPDAEVAGLLESAAERARRQGASDLAAEFAHHSVRLTPSDDTEALLRRTLAEIECLAAAGEMSTALALADQLVAALPRGPGRVEALVRRAQLEDDDLERGEAFLIEALGDAEDDQLLRGRVLDQLGWLRGIFLGDLRAGIEAARESVAIADRITDPELQMSAAAGLAVMAALAGRPTPDLMARAVALQEEIGRPRLWAGPRTLLAEQRLWAGDLSSARALLEGELRHAVQTGNERWRLYDLYDLASVECAAGNLARADELVDEAMEGARDSEDAHVESWVLQRRAQVAAWLGRAAEARAAAERRLDEAMRREARPGIARMRALLGLLALSEGDAETAARELANAAQLLEEMGMENPAAIPALPDAIEALAGSGEIATALALFERLEQQAEALDNDLVGAMLDRCRGVVLLARGNADAAIMPLERAAVAFDRMEHRPEAARALLVLGRALLRAGHRSRAADALADARERFAVMGAALWEARAAEELERAAPGRATGELTPAERRVAGLVAQGAKNREIGQTLFMSVATVEAHLTRIYRKLGIRGRSELTRLVAAGEISVADGEEPAEQP